MSEWNKCVGEIIAELRMMQTSFKGFFWLVEGPSDIRFFTTRKNRNVELIAAGGKTNIINTIRKLQEDPINTKILGIVDSDIDWLIPQPERPSNIISTDPRDIEGMLLRSTALDKILSEYAEPEKIHKFEQKAGKTVREYIHDTSEFFGKIRAVNELKGKVSLRKLKPQIFIMKNSWSYDFDAALKFTIDRGVCTSTDELLSLISNLPTMDQWYYVRGHDAVNILTGGLLKEIGRGTPIYDSMIESMLRVGIEEHEYHESNLYRAIENWHYNSLLENKL
jgi:hypothetical protein